MKVHGKGGRNNKQKVFDGEGVCGYAWQVSLLARQNEKGPTRKEDVRVWGRDPLCKREKDQIVPEGTAVPSGLDIPQ